MSRNPSPVAPAIVHADAGIPAWRSPTPRASVLPPIATARIGPSCRLNQDSGRGEGVIYGDYVDEVLCYQATVGVVTERYFPHYNHLYSVAALTDSTGTIVERFAYDSYGRQGITSAGGVSRMRSAVGWDRSFTGYISDEETGLLHARARQYSPTLGIFVERNDYFTDVAPHFDADPRNYSRLMLMRVRRPSVGTGYIDGMSSYVAAFAQRQGIDPSGHPVPPAVVAAGAIGITAGAAFGGGMLIAHATFDDGLYEGMRDMYEEEENKIDKSGNVKVEKCSIYIVYGHGSKDKPVTYTPPSDGGCWAVSTITCWPERSVGNIAENNLVPGTPTHDEMLNDYNPDSQSPITHGDQGRHNLAQYLLDDKIAFDMPRLLSAMTHNARIKAKEMCNDPCKCDKIKIHVLGSHLGVRSWAGIVGLHPTVPPGTSTVKCGKKGRR